MIAQVAQGVLGVQLVPWDLEALRAQSVLVDLAFLYHPELPEVRRKNKNQLCLCWTTKQGQLRHSFWCNCSKWVMPKKMQETFAELESWKLSRFKWYSKISYLEKWKYAEHLINPFSKSTIAGLRKYRWRTKLELNIFNYWKYVAMETDENVWKRMKITKAETPSTCHPLHTVEDGVK